MNQIDGGTRSGPAGVHPLAVVLSLIVAAGLVIIVLPIMLALALIGLGILLVGWGYFAVRMWLGRARMPNGALDGRRNVRVRMPGEPGAPPDIGDP